MLFGFAPPATKPRRAFMTTLQSPCTLVCSIDLKTGYCFGCGRTGAEIAGWIGYTPEMRQQLLADLPARLATVERKPRRLTRRQRMAQGDST